MKKVYLILQESGEYSSYSSEPISIYEKYDDACFDVACRIETERQENIISNIKEEWRRSNEYRICAMHLNNSEGDINYLPYESSKAYKDIVASDQYIKFIENLNKNNEQFLKESLLTAQKRRESKEEANRIALEEEEKKFKDLLENDKKFAIDYLKNGNTMPINQTIVNRIARVAMHTNNIDMIEWVLKHRSIN